MYRLILFPVCIVFIFLLAGTTLSAQVLTRGPYLQMGNKTSTIIRWQTDVPAKSKITLGTTYGTYPIVVTDNNMVTEHIIRVGGLSTDTRYYYTVETDVAKLQGDSNNFFNTAPHDTTTRKITIAAWGDCGRNDNNYQTNTLSQYKNYIQSRNLKSADVMLLLGDNAYQNGTHTEYTTLFFNAYDAALLKNHMLFPTPGNHDYANDAARQADHLVPYYDIFSVPDSAQIGGVPSYNKAYYSFNWGNIHFISLDSYGLEDGGTTRLYDTNGKQVQWIKADLAANTKKWTVAYWHHPPYTMGSHNSDNEADLAAIRQNFIQILERNGVDLILCGHSHDYERSYLLKGHYGTETTFSRATHAVSNSSAKYDGSNNSCPYIYPSGKTNHGMVYVVAGSAGASGTVQAGYPHDALPFSFNDGGMLFFEIENNRLDAKFIRQDGVIADKFTIIKDANKKDTVYIAPGNSIDIRASWIGSYVWDNAATSRAINVSPLVTTVYTVKDSANNACIKDEIVVKVGFPANVTSSDKLSIEAHPVPAKDVLHVEMNNLYEGNYTFTIYDIEGRILQTLTEYLGKGKQKINIDIHTLPVSQILMLKVNNNNTYKSFRFTREN